MARSEYESIAWAEIQEHRRIIMRDAPPGFEDSRMLKRRPSPKRKLIALSLATTAVLGVSACGAGGESAGAKATTQTSVEVTTSPPSPTAAPEISPTVSPTKGTEYYSQVVEKRNQMDVGEFELLPRDERLAFAQYRIDQTVERGIYDLVYGPGKTNAQYAHTYTKDSPDNTGQEILDNDLFKLQVAYIQFVEGELKPYDVVNGQKVLSAGYWDVSGTVIMNDYNTTKQQEQTLGHMTPLGNKYTAISTSEMLDYTDISGKVVQSKIVTMSDANNRVQYERFVYHEYMGYDNKIKGIWIRENTTDTLAGLTSS